MTTAHDIVTALASIDPLYNTADRTECVLCGVYLIGPFANVLVREHSPTCPWRQAREHVANNTSACGACGETFPDDPMHPGYPDLHSCRATRLRDYRF